MFEKIAESLVALALRFLVWLSENHYRVFCDLQRYIPAGLWEAYVAYLDNEPVVTPAEGLYKEVVFTDPIEPMISLEDEHLLEAAHGSL